MKMQEFEMCTGVIVRKLIPHVEVRRVHRTIDELVLKESGKFDCLTESNQGWSILRNVVKDPIPGQGYSVIVPESDDALYLVYLLRNEGKSDYPTAIYQLDQNQPVAVLMDSIREITRDWKKEGNIFIITEEIQDDRKRYEFWYDMNFIRESLLYRDTSYQIGFFLPVKTYLSFLRGGNHLADWFIKADPLGLHP